jgi:hypothetical protein
MSEDRTRGRQASRRAFRPTLDGRLESRFLLSHGAALRRPAALMATPHHRIPIQAQTANGGRAVVITDRDGVQFEVTVTSALQAPGAPMITAGTVRARRLPRGRVGLIVEGTNQDSELAINPILKPAFKGGAHEFAAGQKFNDHLLHVGSIKVTSGEIGSILGYRTADLSGPIVLTSTASVNRIAFSSLLPGASITVGGDLDTLDILNALNLNGGTGIVVGRDLNLINVGQNLTLDNGASIIVARDVGLSAQPAKGTGPGGQGGLVLGDLVLGPTSFFTIGRSLDAPFIVDGSGSGVSRISVGVPGSSFIFRGGATP